MSWAAIPIRRRSHAHDQGVAGPGVPRPHAAGDRAPAPDGEVGPAGPHVVEQRQQLGGVERAVAVHERRRSRAVAATSPACTAAPYPGTARRRPWRPSRRATSAVPSREPLSTTITRNPAGTRGSSAAQGGRLVAARQHEVADGLHVATRRQAGPPRKRLGNLTNP